MCYGNIVMCDLKGSIIVTTLSNKLKRSGLPCDYLAALVLSLICGRYKFVNDTPNAQTSCCSAWTWIM